MLIVIISSISLLILLGIYYIIYLRNRNNEENIQIANQLPSKNESITIVNKRNSQYVYNIGTTNNVHLNIENDNIVINVDEIDNNSTNNINNNNINNNNNNNNNNFPNSNRTVKFNDYNNNNNANVFISENQTINKNFNEQNIPNYESGINTNLNINDIHNRDLKNNNNLENSNIINTNNNNLIENYVYYINNRDNNIENERKKGKECINEVDITNDEKNLPSKLANEQFYSAESLDTNTNTLNYITNPLPVYEDFIDDFKIKAPITPDTYVKNEICQDFIVLPPRVLLEDQSSNSEKKDSENEDNKVKKDNIDNNIISESIEIKEKNNINIINMNKPNEDYIPNYKNCLPEKLANEQLYSAEAINTNTNSINYITNPLPVYEDFIDDFKIKAPLTPDTFVKNEICQDFIVLPPRVLLEDQPSNSEKKDSENKDNKVKKNNSNNNIEKNSEINIEK